MTPKALEFYRNRWLKVNRKKPHEVLKFFLDYADLTKDELFTVTGMSDFTISMFKKACKTCRRNTIELSNGLHVFKALGFKRPTRVPDPPSKFSYAWVKDMARQGYSVKSIARVCGKKHPEIAAIIRHYKLSNYKPNNNPFRNKEWLTKELVYNNKSIREVAQEAGVERYTIRRWMSRFSITPEFMSVKNVMAKTTGNSVGKAPTGS